MTSAGPQAIEQLKRELGMFCPVSKVLRGSGTEVKELWNVRAP